MADYCETCNRSFGDPDYHGVGPSIDEWGKHYDHLFPISIGLTAIKEKKRLQFDYEQELVAQDRGDLMILERFMRDYNQASYDLEEFARGAAEISDHSGLRNAAVAFLEAKKFFENELLTVDVEVG